jgi:hypothetical protein
LDSFWNLNIEDLKSLKELVPGSLLVSFDLEYSSNKSDSTPQNVNEAGLAFLQLDIDNHLWPFSQDGDLETFYEQNHIKAYSIRPVEIPEKKGRRERLRFGAKIVVDSHKVDSTIIELLSTAVAATSPKQQRYSYRMVNKCGAGVDLPRESSDRFLPYCLSRSAGHGCFQRPAKPLANATGNRSGGS